MREKQLWFYEFTDVLVSNNPVTITFILKLVSSLKSIGTDLTRLKYVQLSVTHF